MTKPPKIILRYSYYTQDFDTNYIHVDDPLIDGFHSIFSLWQLEGKGSCDVDIDQSAGSMVM